jgi:hypothetical protein
MANTGNTNNDRRFVHVLLLQCPACEDAIAVTDATPEANLEEIDARTFDSRCPCGWTGQVVGIQARRHWVEPWSESQ